MPNALLLAKPRHSTIELRQFVDSYHEFFIIGTGWQAQNYRRWLVLNGKKVLAFIKSPLLPPLETAPLRHRFSGKTMDFLNSAIDQCEDVVEDYVGDSFHGIPVLDPMSVDWKRAKTIICLEKRPLEVVSWLRERRLHPYLDFIAFPDMIFWPNTAWGNAVGLPFFEYWESNKDNFQRAANCFDDETSIRLYEKTILFRTRALEFETVQQDEQPESFDTWKLISESYHQTRDKYSIHILGLDELALLAPKLAEFIRNLNPFGIPRKIMHRASWIISSGVFNHILDKDETGGRVILDCGAFEGESSAALHWLFPTSTVYAFEPLKVAFRKLHSLSKRIPAIVPIEKGTWISSEVATINIAGEGSRVNSSHGIDEQSIVLTSIDEFVDDQQLARVDAIKMNIEGAEMPSLKGATRTITRFNPSLSICAEHLPSDLWEIPMHLKHAHSNYSLSFKHFGPHIWASYVIGRARS